MLSPDEISRLAGRQQTGGRNVAREYAQHVILSALYADPGSDRVLFKGGTALRILFNSPRYSEDLDFTADLSFHKAKSLMDRVSIKVRQEIEGLRLKESKQTTGGYFGILAGPVGPWEVEVLVQMSFRHAGRRGKLLPAYTDLTAPYNLLALPEDVLVSEKIDALLARAKPRDFFDLYFILRKPLGQRAAIAVKRPAILKKVGTLEKKSLYQDLREFLPRSHWPIIKDLPANLRQELARL